MTRSLLGLDSAEQTKQVHQHDTVCGLRAAINSIDLATVFGERSERRHVVDESFNILIRALIEGGDGVRRPAASTLVVDALVAFDGRATVTRSCDHDTCSAMQQSVQDFNADRAFSNSSEESVLVLEQRARGRDFVKDIEVNAAEVATVFPGGANLALETEKREQDILSAESEVI